MMTIKYIITIGILSCSNFVYGQTNKAKETCIAKFDSISKRTIYTSVDSMPEYPGGNDSLVSFIKHNLKWPNEGDLTPGDYGTMYITFIVEPDGSLTNKRILRGIYSHADDEALRVINLMPKWKAGKYNGRTVPVKCVMPIRFALKE